MTNSRSLLAFTALFVLSAAGTYASDAPPIATILCYHEVDDHPEHETVPRRSATGETPKEQRRYTATTAQFIEQLDYLEQNGYCVVPLEDVVAAVDGTKSLPPKAVAITVDDGWACTYTTMLPILRERRLPFTLFVYPHIIDRGTHAMTSAQLAAMAGAENVEIGSHAYTHPFLTLKNNPGVADEYPRFLERELLGSKKAIERITGKPVRFLSYPYGDYDAAVMKAAESYGYRGAVTVERGRITPSATRLMLKRYLIHNTTTLEQFKTFLPAE